MRVDRRRALLGLAALAAACRREQPDPGPPPPMAAGAWRDLAFDPDADAPDGERALLFAPEGAATLPLVVALHGRGESGRGLEAGARGWRDDYGLERLHLKLSRPPIAEADLLGFASPARLARMNELLAAEPYRGIAVATPFAPDLADRSPAGAAAFGRFVTGALLPRARADIGAAASRARTGIDGVSMGGRLALLVGFAHPDVFGAVGALQPAIGVAEADLFASLAHEASLRAPQKIRLASSDGDPFLGAVRAFAGALARRGVAHDLVVWPGPHDYAWNRGPGSAELLFWHERVLRGLPAI